MKSSSRGKVFFLFILIAILFLINFWMGRELTPPHPLQYHEVFHAEVKANLFNLGASSAMHAINPRYVEADHLKVCNLGSSPN